MKYLKKFNESNDLISELGVYCFVEHDYIEVIYTDSRINGIGIFITSNDKDKTAELLYGGYVNYFLYKDIKDDLNKFSILVSDIKEIESIEFHYYLRNKVVINYDELFLLSDDVLEGKLEYVKISLKK